MKSHLVITVALVLLPVLCGAAEKPGLASGEIIDAAYLMKLGAGLAAVIGLFIAMAWIMRNMGVGTVSKDGVERLKVKATLSVGNRERILLVDACGDQVLIGVTQERIDTLHVIRAENAQTRAEFSAELEKRLQEDGGKE